MIALTKLLKNLKLQYIIVRRSKFGLSTTMVFPYLLVINVVHQSGGTYAKL